MPIAPFFVGVIFGWLAGMSVHIVTGGEPTLFQAALLFLIAIVASGVGVCLIARVTR